MCKFSSCSKISSQVYSNHATPTFPDGIVQFREKLWSFVIILFMVFSVLSAPTPGYSTVTKNYPRTKCSHKKCTLPQYRVKSQKMCKKDLYWISSFKFDNFLIENSYIIWQINIQTATCVYQCNRFRLILAIQWRSHDIL